jgi:hypothetical protein
MTNLGPRSKQKTKTTCLLARGWARRQMAEAAPSTNVLSELNADMFNVSMQDLFKPKFNEDMFDAEMKEKFKGPLLLTDAEMALAERHAAQGERQKVYEIFAEAQQRYAQEWEREKRKALEQVDADFFLEGVKLMKNQEMFDVSKQLPRLRREVAVTGKAAELRALGLATAEALVQQRAAFLADVEATAKAVKAERAGREDPRSLLHVARANTAVAQAREELAKTELTALEAAAAIAD